MSGTVERADAILSACKAWVKQHHRTELTGKEATYIRAKLKERLHDRMLPKAADVELVQLAHRLANSAVDRRRLAAQQDEHARMVRA